MLPADVRLLDAAAATAAAEAHARRVDALLTPLGGDPAAIKAHPVWSFLVTYYPHRLSRLRRWHPGPGVRAADPDGDVAALPGHRVVPGDVPWVEVDPAYVADRADTIRHIHDLLAATASRPPMLRCFGLHEWAMVYRHTAVERPRHDVPLRLGPDGTDAVVESMPLRCSHVDAVRFFTDAAVGRNAWRLSRADQVAREQPGCIHAGMDLYKWATKLGPLVSAELTADAFELAVAHRELDMRASPYDLADLGFPPVRIETTAGRAEYVRAQSALAEAAAPLRERLIATCETLLTAHSGASVTG